MAATALFTSIVGIDTDVYHKGEMCRPCVTWKRVAPHDTACSAIYVRMAARGTNSGQMPPVASKHADLAEVDAVGAWIESL